MRPKPVAQLAGLSFSCRRDRSQNESVTQERRLLQLQTHDSSPSKHFRSCRSRDAEAVWTRLPLRRLSSVIIAGTLVRRRATHQMVVDGVFDISGRLAPVAAPR